MQRFLPHLTALTRRGAPLVLSLLVSIMLGVTDTVMMGWYGVSELAALVLGAGSFFLLFILGGGFASVLMGVVAAAIGRGDDDYVRRATRMGFWLSVLFSLAMLPVMWASGAILIALWQDPEIAIMAQTYLRVLAPALIPALIAMCLRSYLAVLERSAILFWVALAGLGLNIVLNWLLIFGHGGLPEMGLQGAALASLITHLAMAGALLAYAAWLPMARRYHLFSRIWRPDWPVFIQVFRLGLPVGLTSLAEAAMFNATAIMMGQIGTVELAAHGIALQVTSITFMFHVGLSNAATVRIGRLHGASDREGMRDAALAAIAMSLGFAGLTALVFFSLPGPIISLFLTDGESQAGAILSIGAALLLMSALFQFCDALQCQAAGFLRGVQDTRVPMWLAVFSYWVIGIPAGYLLAFPAGLGPRGVWLGLVVGLSVASVLLMTRFWRHPAVRRG